MISSARIGTGRGDFNRRQTGDSNSPADFINTAAMAAEEWSLSSTEPASAISLKHFSAAGADVPRSEDLADAKQPDFTVEGSDLIHEVKIAPWQAALGSALKVPTLEGNVKLKIPPGTQGGQRFRLRERALPSASGKRGDLYIVAQIQIPKKLGEREREIWSQLAKLHGS